MNKILKLSAIALLASSTSLMAQTKSFEGGSIGLQVGMAGGELDGSSTTTSNGNTTSGNGGSASAGKITALAGLDLGYGFAAGNNFVFGVGATYIPFKAKVATGTGNDTTSGTTSSVELKDHYTLYIQPTFVLNKDSALYVKAQYAHADLTTKNLTTASSSMEGYGAGVGLKTFFNSNAFIQVEANYTEYDTIRGTKSNGSGGTTSVTADPKLLQGMITLGYKF
jgi:hypothetical protein